MTVPQDYELRKALRGAGAKYQVSEEYPSSSAPPKAQKIEEGLKNLTGVTSIAYTTGDPVAMAKALTKYAKDVPEFTFKVGVVEGRVISIKEIEALSSMPSKEELYSKLLFLINAPAQRFGDRDECVGRNLAVVVDQGVKEKKVQGSIACVARAPSPATALAMRLVLVCDCSPGIRAACNAFRRRQSNMAHLERQASKNEIGSRGQGRRATKFGAVKAVRRDLVIGSQGLRGSDPGVVWRQEMNLPHWKPGRR